MFAAAPGRRADLRPGVLLPLRPELGQPRLLSRGRPLAAGRGGAGELHRPVLRRQAGAAAASCCRTTCPTASCWPRRCRIKAERKVEIRVPQRGAKTGLVEHALAQRARGARPQAGGELLAAAAAGRACASASAWRRAPRRIEVFDNSHIQGTNAVGAMIVAGPRRLREEPVPQVQHQVGGPHAGRRLRHDARGADAPLQAPGDRDERAGEEGGRRSSASSRKPPATSSPWPRRLLARHRTKSTTMTRFPIGPTWC